MESAKKLNPETREKLGAIMGNILVQEGADPDDIMKIINLFYEEYVGQYRPFVELLEPTLEMVFKDIAPIIAGSLSGISNALQDNEKVQAVVSEWRKNRAQGRMRNLNAYVEAGFTRDEALALVLQDAANFNAQLARVDRQNGK
jgi:hypothetical protein